MLLSTISNELLEILRSGYVSDDERLDIRLLNQLVHQYRASYLEKNSGKDVPEIFRQHQDFDLSYVDHSTFKRLETTNEIPKIISGKYGPLIEEIYSPYIDEIPFTVVNRTHLRYAGNGKFNQGVVYVAYDNNKLYFNFKDDGYRLMDSVSVAAIFEDPTDCPDFDEETDNYPISQDCINYIKDQFIKNDVKLILGQFSDEINDASGEIKE